MNKISYNERVRYYREILKYSLNKLIRIKYARKKDAVHNIVCKVIKLKKSSLIAEKEEVIFNIGFRNIKDVDIF